MTKEEPATHQARRSLRLARSATVTSKLTDLATASSIFLLDVRFSIGPNPFRNSRLFPCGYFAPGAAGAGLLLGASAGASATGTLVAGTRIWRSSELTDTFCAA